MLMLIGLEFGGFTSYRVFFSRQQIINANWDYSEHPESRRCKQRRQTEQFLIKEIQFIELEEEVDLPYESYICSFCCPFVNRFPAATDFPWYRKQGAESTVFYLFVCLALLLLWHLPVPSQVAARWPIKHLSCLCQFILYLGSSKYEFSTETSTVCTLHCSLTHSHCHSVSLSLYLFLSVFHTAQDHFCRRKWQALCQNFLCHLHAFFLGTQRAAPWLPLLGPLAPLSTRYCAKNKANNLF